VAEADGLVDSTTDTHRRVAQSARRSFPLRLDRGEGQGEVSIGNSPPVFIVCGYNDRPDISEGLAGVYLKFKQLKVPAAIHQQSTPNHQLPKAAATALACGRTTPNSLANGSNASRNGWRAVGF